MDSQLESLLVSAQYAKKQTTKKFVYQQALVGESVLLSRHCEYLGKEERRFDVYIKLFFLVLYYILTLVGLITRFAYFLKECSRGQKRNAGHLKQVG